MMMQSAATVQHIYHTNQIKQSGPEIFNEFSEINDAIARRAFELFESHGSTPGHELEDWSRAESELLHPVPMNITEVNNEYVVRAEVPGFGRENIEIAVEGRCMAISGKRETRAEDENRKLIRSEWPGDRFFRTLDLPSDVDASKISTFLKDGILTVDLPKAQNKE
jgi:HSP20 family molecular chaperone IbpA